MDGKLYKSLLPKVFDGLHKMASTSLQKKVRSHYGTPGFEPGSTEPEERKSVTVLKMESPSISAPRPSSPELEMVADKQELDDDQMEEIRRLLTGK